MNLLEILYENDEILIINKPSGYAVQGGEGIHHSVDKDLSVQLDYKVFLVHRLDKDTAGLMMVAKSSFAASKWTKLIGSKAVQKEYVAVCCGTIEPKNGVIEESVVQHGVEKQAKTYYSVIKEVSIPVEKGDSGEKMNPADEGMAGGEGLKLSLLKLKLDTGRMHQIRIHLAKKGCPIAGDDQHGNFKMNKLLKKQAGIKKLMLASVRLVIPDGNKTKEFSIEIPDYMKVDRLADNR